MARLLFRGLTLAVGLLLAAIALLAWDGWRDDSASAPADVVLVLGTGGVNPDGTITPRQRARLDRAAEFGRDPSVKVFLLSGAPEINGHSETEAMATYLASRGIARSRIALDPGGATTYDTARNTAAFLTAHALHGVIVVTHYYHVPRTRFALARFGVAPLFGAPVRTVEPHDAEMLGREAAGWTLYHFYR